MTQKYNWIVPCFSEVWLTSALSVILFMWYTIRTDKWGHLVHMAHYITWWKCSKCLLCWQLGMNPLSVHLLMSVLLCATSEYSIYSLVTSQISSWASKCNVSNWDRTSEKNSSPCSSMQKLQMRILSTLSQLTYTPEPQLLLFEFHNSDHPVNTK